ncbi:MAG TPA: hypothetical protein VFO30_07430 [Chthoniobacterales bacterium]|nr:hypothetical protein [Chthoniobacterales bacterium]
MAMACGLRPDLHSRRGKLIVLRRCSDWAMNIDNRQEKAKHRVRQLLWLFFWLLLLEGVLRKWIVPQLSDPLLIVRDPIVLLIYYFAIRARIFPRNFWVFLLGVIAFFAVATSLIQLWPYLPPAKTLLVVGYGFRSNFFQLPLIWIIALVFGPEDVKKLGWWTLVFLLPLTMLMVAQFSAPPDAFVNRTAGGGSEIMMSALGKVRTSGTFTFVIGVVAYEAMAAAFLIWAALRRDVYKTRLLIVAGVALVVGVSVSGSRSVVGACALVIASLLVVLFMRADLLNRFGRALIVALILGVIISRTPLVREGMQVLSVRFSEVNEGEQSIARSLLERPIAVFEEGFSVLSKAPLFGYGVGVGTNAGAKFLTGRSVFLLSEGEWSRILLESGPLLGIAYLAWRTALVGRIGWLTLKSVRRGNLLPLLLFSASFLPLVSGQLGQPTILGFAVFVSGLTLAARNTETESAVSVQPQPPARAASAQRVVRGRSVYAERMHAQANRQIEKNGSADR